MTRENSLHGGQVSQHDIHSMNWVGADGFVQVHWLTNNTPCQDFMQHVPADQRYKLNGDFKWAVLPTVTWQGNI